MFQQLGKTRESSSTRSLEASYDRHIASWVAQGSTSRGLFRSVVIAVVALSTACTAQLERLEGSDVKTAEPEDPTGDRTTDSAPGPDAGGNTGGATDDAGRTLVDASVAPPRSPNGLVDASVANEHRDARVSSSEFTSDSPSREGIDAGRSVNEPRPDAAGRDAEVDGCAAGDLCLVATTPSHGSENVPTATHVVLEFNRRVDAGSGTLSVVATASGFVFEEVPLDDSRVSIDGSVVSVDLDGILDGETNYTVTLTDAALTAGAETAFKGLVAGELSFTTTSNELPVANDELLLWVDPSFESSMKVEAGAVTVAGDRSGTNHSLRQSSPGARPALETVDWTELPVLRFDGADVLVASELTEASEQYDVFVVWRSPVSPPSTLTTIFNHGVTDGVQVQLTHGHPVAAFRNAAITRFGSGMFQALQLSTPAANQMYLWNATFDGSRMNVSVDGRAVTGVDIAEAPRTPADVIALGAGPSGNFAFNGFVAELLYFGRSLSASERSLLSEHLLDKWMR